MSEAMLSQRDTDASAQDAAVTASPGAAVMASATEPEYTSVPLIKNEYGIHLLSALVPRGIGLQAKGPLLPNTGEAALDQLNGMIGDAGNDAGLLSHARSFWQSLPEGKPVYAQLLTVAARPDYVPGAPLKISASAADHGGVQAVVLDARSLPAGTTIHVSEPDFVAVVGNVRLTGGQGSIFVAGDGSNQTMVLGMNDPMVWGGGKADGGGGNDTVGGLRGSQELFGGDGDDIVFGGGGNDILSGGAGNDRLNGGMGWDIARQSGARSDYTLKVEGQVVSLTHKATGEVDRFKAIEVIKFDRDTGNVFSKSESSLYIVRNEAEAALAHITSSWLSRDPTADEGVWIQNNGHLSALQVAEALLQGPSGQELQLLNVTAQELVADWQNNSQIARLEMVMYAAFVVDQVHYDLNWADLALENGPGDWVSTSLIDGDMADLKSVSRLHLNDVSVALDVGRQGKAGKLKALMSVTLGGESVADKALVGQGLAALDAGMSLQAVGEVAMRYAQQLQGRAFTDQEVVQWLWTQATYSEGTSEELRPYVEQLQSGRMTRGDLVNAALEHHLVYGTPINVEVKPLLYTL